VGKRFIQFQADHTITATIHVISLPAIVSSRCPSIVSSHCPLCKSTLARRSMRRFDEDGEVDEEVDEKVDGGEEVDSGRVVDEEVDGVEEVDGEVDEEVYVDAIHRKAPQGTVS
jgi:hypothetical protein